MEDSYSSYEQRYVSETSVDSQRSTQRYIPEDSTLDNHCCKNLKSYIWTTISLNVINRLIQATEILSGALEVRNKFWNTIHMNFGVEKRCS
jgi:hypothetical protein